MFTAVGGGFPSATPAGGAGESDAGVEGARPKRWPATRAIRATSAMAANPHGSATEKPRSPVRCVPPSPAGRSPAGVPQRWQNFAPVVRAVWQEKHRAPESTAPQLEQKFPEAGELHERQVGADTGAKYSLQPTVDGCSPRDVQLLRVLPAWP